MRAGKKQSKRLRTSAPRPKRKNGRRPAAATKTKSKAKIGTGAKTQAMTGTKVKSATKAKTKTESRAKTVRGKNAGKPAGRPSPVIKGGSTRKAAKKGAVTRSKGNDGKAVSVTAARSQYKASGATGNREAEGSQLAAGGAAEETDASIAADTGPVVVGSSSPGGAPPLPIPIASFTI
jgi:hypothetical protein